MSYVQLGIALGQKLAGDKNAEIAQKLREEEIDKMLQARTTKIYRQMNAVYAAQAAGFAAGGTEGSGSVMKGIAKEGESAVRDERIDALEAKRASAYQTEVQKMQSTMKLIGAAASAAGGYAGSSFGGTGAGAGGAGGSTVPNMGGSAATSTGSSLLVGEATTGY